MARRINEPDQREITVHLVIVAVRGPFGDAVEERAGQPPHLPA